jgi:hypothetical protein
MRSGKNRTVPILNRHSLRRWRGAASTRLAVTAALRVD